ncbi:GNAT family N-acetyltransferase [Achromobacter pestifer]|uniref:GNAT family N-acetyltransferase n=1 Tax=Achromobacter pestifer TaxID=1353889 RepID=UPI00158211AA|nr:GNAT family N-acetyltransferase [Achromobacter pestifer]
MDLLIRAAHNDDIDALGALKLRSALAWGDHVDELLALPEARQFSAAHLPYAMVAELDGTLVGFITVVPGTGTEAELEDLFVAPELWRTGVGTRLLNEAEHRAIEHGIRSLHVVVGDRARSFYEASGFLFIAAVETEFSHAVRMRKTWL